MKTRSQTYSSASVVNRRLILFGMLILLGCVTSIHAQPGGEKGFLGWFALTATNTDNGSRQEAYIFINTQSTHGYDPMFDALFQPGNGPVFYSLSGEEQLSRNSIPDLEDNVNISFVFRPEGGTRFQIEAAGLDMIDPQVWMYDNLTRADHNFSLEPVYSFLATPQDDSLRFLVHFQAESIHDPLPAGVQETYYANGFLHLPVINDGESAILFNLSGTKINEYRGVSFSNAIVSLNIPKGIYLLKVLSGSKASTRKILVG